MEYLRTYDKSWAVVIGIDAYQAMPPLRYAVADASAVANVLISDYHFPRERVFLLLDHEATQHNIRRLIEERISDPNVVGEDDRLIFFFAGHGVTRRGQTGEAAYLAPVDARPNVWHTLIPMRYVLEAAYFIPAKHIFFVTDACYSGVEVMRGVADYSADMIARQSWQIITAGRADQQVVDGGGPHGRNSLFTAALLEGLRGHAADEQGVISGSSLMAYVYRKVTTDPRTKQTPVYGWLRGEGDFVFRSAAPEGLPQDIVQAMQGATLASRMAAIGELALLSVRADRSLAHQAIQALERLSSSDPNELVRITAQHALDEALLIATEPTRPAFVQDELEAIDRERHTVAPSQEATLPTGAAPETQPQRRAAADQVERNRLSIGLGLAVLALLFVVILWLTTQIMTQNRVIQGLQASAQAAGAGIEDSVFEGELFLESTVSAGILATKQIQATATAVTLGMASADPEATPLPTPTPTTVPPSVAPTAVGGAGSSGLMEGREQNPTTLPGTDVIFVEDFNTDAGRWQIGNAHNTQRVIEDGRLFFRLGGQYSLWFAMPYPGVLSSVQDFVLDVEGTIHTPNADGALVVVFRAQQPFQTQGYLQIDDYYYIGIDLDGNIFMFKQQNGQTSIIVPLTPLRQGRLEAGVPIHIRIVGERETYTVYVNGVQEIVGRELNFLGGRIALAAWSRGIVPFEVSFDNLTVAIPAVAVP